MATTNGIKKIIVNLDSLQSKSPKKQTKKRSMIEPNKLKDAFMKQVQQYKSVANSQKNKPPLQTATTNAYTSDFNESVAYLNTIKKSTDAVHIELPVELMEEKVTNAPMLVDNKLTLNNPQTIPNPNPNSTPKQTSTPSSSSSSFSLNPSTTTSTAPQQYTVDSAVPYGCLKNGIKPSFKNWTRSNRAENRVPIITPTTTTPITITPTITNTTNTTCVPTEVVTPRIMPIEQTTIIKRHVIGKTKNTRQVGVLIKNINTRKMIVGAHKDLKKINISEVKTHLKNNGLLKVGSTAPVDLLRQTYESSILAGNIVNKSGDILYHNFINDTELTN